MKVLVLSPHRDDAAFSCGLLLRELLLCSVDVTIANICTVSDYAPYAEVASDDHTQHVTGTRAEEDRQFARELCSGLGPQAGKLEWLDLAWRDAPLRWHIPTDEVLDAQALRAPEVAALAHSFSPFAAHIVLAPLGLGDHVDHLLTREAARHTFKPESLLFYEDLPYACRMSETDRANAVNSALSVLCQAWMPNARSAPGTKQNYASCYPSQIATAVAAEMELYAKELNERERFYGTDQAQITVARMLAGRAAHA